MSDVMETILNVVCQRITVTTTTIMLANVNKQQNCIQVRLWTVAPFSVSHH